MGNRREGRRDQDGWSGALLGPRFEADEIERWLKDLELPYLELDDDELAEHVAGLLAEGALVGRFSGRMEFGPRALGNRSILADPRDPGVVERLNGSIKRRESFRPFAPAVLEEHAHEWFDLDRGADRPYMTHTARVLGAEPARRVSMGDAAAALSGVRSPLPACTHVDGSARVQTVRRARNPGFHSLIAAFGRATGCPVVLNTSFNRAGQPIVRTPADALRCHRDAGLDALVLERFVIGAGR